MRGEVIALLPQLERDYLMHRDLSEARDAAEKRGIIIVFTKKKKNEKKR